MNAKRLLVELIGTFFLVFTVGMAVTNAGDLAPLAIGSVLMVMVFAGGHISGAHYNPAVTMAVWLRGRASSADLVAYWIAQLAGAGLAGLVVVQLVERSTTAFSPEVAWQALLVEFLFTFALAYVVLHTATSKGTDGNSYYGLAIGFTLVAGIYSVGAISGGAFNPAVVVGGWVTNAFDVGATWPYLIVQLGAGAAAALAFRLVSPATDVEPASARTATARAAAQTTG
jgi:aquaporin Z